MHFIPSRIHGMLDYLIGLLLILSPRLFGFHTGGAEEKLPVLFGVAALGYSLATRYELGLFKVLSFRRHLTFDFFGGILLAISPWLLGFSDRAWAPHLVFGLLAVGAAVVTIPFTTLPDPMSPVR